MSLGRVLPRPFTHGGDIHKASMGGLMRGDIDLMGGRPNFDRLYHELKVLLLLSCNYTMQLVGYDSIKTRLFVSYHFQIRTITHSINTKESAR